RQAPDAAAVPGRAEELPVDAAERRRGRRGTGETTAPQGARPDPRAAVRRAARTREEEPRHARQRPQAGCHAQPLPPRRRASRPARGRGGFAWRAPGGPGADGPAARDAEAPAPPEPGDPVGDGLVAQAAAALTPPPGPEIRVKRGPDAMTPGAAPGASRT